VAAVVALTMALVALVALAYYFFIIKKDNYGNIRSNFKQYSYKRNSRRHTG